MHCNITLIEPEAVVPYYATEGSSGVDLTSVIDTVIKPMETSLIKTGIIIELHDGYEAQIRSRSGLALRNSVVVLNSPGTIDSDYRGEIGVILINYGKEDFQVKKGMRIAQMVFSKIEKFQLDVTASVSTTSRSSGGFGSTGV